MTALVLAHEPNGLAGQVGVRLGERGLEIETHIVTHDYLRPQQHAMWPDWDAYDLDAVRGGRFRHSPDRQVATSCRGKCPNWFGETAARYAKPA